jgi:hypothetical protein
MITLETPTVPDDSGERAMTLVVGCTRRFTARRGRSTT